MSNLEEFLNSKLPEDQDDMFMKKITKLRMDGLQKNYEQKLKDSYGISKDNKIGSKKKRTIIILAIVAIIVGLLFVLFASNLTLGNNNNYPNGIASYIQKNKIHNYDIVRGAAGKDAYDEYQLENYSQAISIWEGNDMDLQDSFYLALSHLYAGDYNKAEAKFSELNQKIGPNDKYYSESQLYWALTLNLLNDDKASTIYNSWPKDSWMTKEYKVILKLKE